MHLYTEYETEEIARTALEEVSDAIHQMFTEERFYKCPANIIGRNGYKERCLMCQWIMGLPKGLYKCPCDYYKENLREEVVNTLYSCYQCISIAHCTRRGNLNVPCEEFKLIKKISPDKDKMEKLSFKLRDEYRKEKSKP